MAFDKENMVLYQVAQSPDGQTNLWRYVSDDDDLATIQGAGYFVEFGDGAANDGQQVLGALDVIIATGTDGNALLAFADQTAADAGTASAF